MFNFIVFKLSFTKNLQVVPSSYTSLAEYHLNELIFKTFGSNVVPVKAIMLCDLIFHQK
jgi:hypothetical protein